MERWIYETGREESEILGSGSSYYSIFRTNSEEEAMQKSHEAGRNYLVRSKVTKDRETIRQYYNYYRKIWE